MSEFRKWRAPATVALGGFAFIVGAGIVAATFFAPHHSDTPSRIPGQPDISAKIPQEVAPPADIPASPPRLTIEKIGVDMDVVEGLSEVALLKGAWRSPYGSTPNKGGNTTLLGHRYLHRPPNPETFWNLDKLVPGDTFTVDWEGKTYTYRVVQILVVKPKDVWVMDQTPTPMVTLITCTPLYSTKQRLVVRAELQE